MARKVKPRRYKACGYRFADVQDMFVDNNVPWDSDDIWLHDRDFINQSANHNLTSFSL